MATCPLVRAQAVSLLIKETGNIQAVKNRLNESGVIMAIDSICECQKHKCAFWNADMNVCGQSAPYADDLAKMACSLNDQITNGNPPFVKFAR